MNKRIYFDSDRVFEAVLFVIPAAVYCSHFLDIHTLEDEWFIYGFLWGGLGRLFSFLFFLSIPSAIVLAIATLFNIKSLKIIGAVLGLLGSLREPFVILHSSGSAFLIPHTLVLLFWLFLIIQFCIKDAYRAGILSLCAAGVMFAAFFSLVITGGYIGNYPTGTDLYFYDFDGNYRHYIGKIIKAAVATSGLALAPVFSALAKE